ncbi:GNAT family N-acetyltransferase [Peribacillus loiseleuriae]|uniref:N-acetyltransferase domain-containing protein n=1 Tax=Peribacillus loiseleuriae TaxID=1679170 RepID=A0A0K9GSF2_9BACI|nr:GNAT family N-acetyltransferase [Peribacillus loiseleuriae]KMY49560.1 hypothetical protein AC625_08380 [Peribacillus loiseleuriae]
MERFTIEDLLGIKKRKVTSDEPENSIKLVGLQEFERSKENNYEIVYTKRNEPVLLVKPKVFDSLATFRLFTYTFGHIECFRIHFHRFCDEIEIIDVVVIGEEFHNKGYGTVLIQEVIKYAENVGSKRIYGSIVNDSLEQHQRQISFYSKNGFTLYDDNYKFEMLFEKN